MILVQILKLPDDGDRTKSQVLQELTLVRDPVRPGETERPDDWFIRLGHQSGTRTGVSPELADLRSPPASQVLSRAHLTGWRSSRPVAHLVLHALGRCLAAPELGAKRRS